MVNSWQKANTTTIWRGSSKHNKDDKILLKFRMWFKYGLKAQKLLAQGSALGIMAISKAPCFTLIEQALSVFFNVNYV